MDAQLSELRAALARETSREELYACMLEALLVSRPHFEAVVVDAGSDLHRRVAHVSTIPEYAPLAGSFGAFDWYVLDKFEAIIDHREVLDVRHYADTAEILAWQRCGELAALRLDPQYTQEDRYFATLVKPTGEATQLPDAETCRAAIEEGACDLALPAARVRALRRGGGWCRRLARARGGGTAHSGSTGRLDHTAVPEGRGRGKLATPLAREVRLGGAVRAGKRGRTRRTGGFGEQRGAQLRRDIFGRRAGRATSAPSCGGTTAKDGTASLLPVVHAAAEMFS